jgi:hypothetical protein
MGKEKMMFGGDILSNLKNIFTKDVVYETDEDGNFCVILKPLKEQRKYENMEDEVFYKMPEKYLEKEDVGDFFVKQSNVFLPNAQLSSEEIERKFGVKLSNKAKEIYTDKSKAKEKSDIEQLVQQYKVAVESRNYAYASKLKNLILSVRESKKFATVGGFENLSKSVAKNYEGKRVKSAYHKEYGKVYSKEEAKEVGDKVAGKVKANQKMATGGEVKLSDLKVESGMGAGKKTWEVSYPKIQGKGVYFQDQYTKEEAKEHWLENVASKYKFATGGATKKGGKGGIMVLAKKIRKDGEKWNDAVKRAGQQLK